ncbi:hypothetical protein LTR78_008528 [Recurvomyces mirabilis]|uniref:Uncharacterized protein n=1 Tax=Recurvomyces mirabilis TaxID=574656 RepID=A0AAE0TTL9_9PEZI|nr:hypothetical protein LTR78_008528 [Recurvomyces mirabilis]KAK5156279.1 hypothetical protein LTS14_005167 [Recurvomyces mirabilis]
MGCVKSRHSRDGDDINSLDTEIDAQIAADIDADADIVAPIFPHPTDSNLQSIDNVSPKCMDPSHEIVKIDGSMDDRTLQSVENTSPKNKKATIAAAAMAIDSDQKKSTSGGEVKTDGATSNKPSRKKSASDGEGETKDATASKPEPSEIPGGVVNTKTTSDDQAAKDRIDSKAQDQDNKDRMEIDDPAPSVLKSDLAKELEAETAETSNTTADTSNQTANEEGTSDEASRHSPPSSPPSTLKTKLLHLPFRALTHPTWILRNQRRKRHRHQTTETLPPTTTTTKATQSPPQSPLPRLEDKTIFSITDPPLDPTDPLSPRIDHCMTRNPPEEFSVLAPRPAAKDGGLKDGLGWLPLRLCPYGCNAFPYAREFETVVDAPLWVDSGKNEWEVTVRGFLGNWGVEYEGVGDIYYHTHAPSRTRDCDTLAFALEIPIPPKKQEQQEEENFIWLHLKPRDQAVLLLTRCLFHWKDNKIDFSGDGERFEPVLTVLDVSKGTSYAVQWAVMKVVGRSGLEWSDVVDVKYHLLDQDCDTTLSLADKDPVLRPFHGELQRQS